MVHQSNPKGFDMASSKSIHVTKHKSGDWQYKTAGNSKATKVMGTQKECINLATEQAKRNGAELFIHGKNGQIREKNSYGKDPYPPRG